MKGLFIGLATLDLIYLTKGIPRQNEKITALEQIIASGGPASNAAVAFSYFGHSTKFLGVIGNHPLSYLIRSDLAAFAIEIIDLEPNRLESPPVSSIIVTQSTGDRAVISVNAIFTQGKIENLPANILDNIDIVLIDGHQIGASQEIALKAQQAAIPVVLDGGSWKPGLEKILPYINYAICSANFYPPDCNQPAEVIQYLQQQGIKYIAITNGSQPIYYVCEEKTGIITIPTIQAIDTLGAGDIFHGAFCHYLGETNFIEAIAKAANIATYSCEFLGTRAWMEAGVINSNFNYPIVKPIY